MIIQHECKVDIDNSTDPGEAGAKVVTESTQKDPDAESLPGNIKCIYE